MDTNKKLILDKFEKLKGQFVIVDSWHVERLVAVATDTQDYYWITYNGRILKWNSCVGSIIKLKGKIDDDAYNEFERIAKLNHYDKLIGNGVEYDGIKYTLDGYKRSLMKEWDDNDNLLTNIIFSDEEKK